MPLQKYQVEVCPVESDKLSEYVAKNCFFCHKLVKASPEAFQSMQKLTGTKFYCSFCIRHNFHYRTNCNILLMSYRGIIGYYYLKNYLDKHYNLKRLWWSDIDLFIKQHAEIGMTNPVFTYDPDTFMWFVDFNRIGVAGKKMPYELVEQTTKKMLEAFKVKVVMNPYVETQMLSKYTEAMKLFYEKRQRPPEKRMLIPTLSQQGQTDEGLLEKTRNFLKKHLVVV